MHLQSVKLYQEKSQSSKVKKNFNNHSVPSFGMSENAGQTTDVFEKNNNKTAPGNAEKPAAKNTAAVKNEIKNEIKQGAQKLEDTAKKELKEIKNELAANLPKQRGGGKFKKIFFLIIAPLGAIAAAAAKFKDRILVFLKGIRNENSSSNGTEYK